MVYERRNCSPLATDAGAVALKITLSECFSFALFFVEFTQDASSCTYFHNSKASHTSLALTCPLSLAFFIQ